VTFTNSTGRTLRVLTFSTLYPNAANPGHGPFVEQRLRKLVEAGGIEARVVAPVPWFPFKHARFGEYARFAAAPSGETRHGLSVAHPRYLVIPKLGMWLTPLLLALGALPTLWKWRRQGWKFDLIDAHYYYPDGVAAGLLARWFRVPLAITARGTDLNLIADQAVPKRMILWAAGVAGASIGVCRALADRLVQLGANAKKVHVLRNGVDLERFVPVPQAEARARVGGPALGKRLVSVGYLIERKGQALTIAALRDLPEWHLDLVGRGPMEAKLRALAQELGVADRVRFVGAVPQEELRFHYAAADLSVLASDREGWANVLLESMACGTPVVAADIWGTPEVVQSVDAGVLFAPRTAAALGQAVATYAPVRPAANVVRRYAEGFSWDDTTRGQQAVFATLMERRFDA
jgi:glycosyltransferase involved in cell wall biosynthesis